MLAVMVTKQIRKVKSLWATSSIHANPQSLIFAARRYAKRGICYANSARLSGCPSVRHPRALYQNG